MIGTYQTVAMVFENISWTLSIHYINYFIHEIRPFLVGDAARVIDEEIIGHH